MQILAIWDKRALAYVNFFFARTIGLACRQFETAVQDPSHDFNKFAEDYELVHLGGVDELTGEIEPTHKPIPVQTALSIKEAHGRTEDA